MTRDRPTENGVTRWAWRWCLRRSGRRPRSWRRPRVGSATTARPRSPGCPTRCPAARAPAPPAPSPARGRPGSVAGRPAPTPRPRACARPPTPGPRPTTPTPPAWRRWRARGCSEVVTIAQLESWQPARLSSIADDLNTHRSKLVDLQDEIDDGRPPASWVGVDSFYAEQKHTELAERLVDDVAEIATVISALDTAAT